MSEIPSECLICYTTTSMMRKDIIPYMCECKYHIHKSCYNRWRNTGTLRLCIICQVHLPPVNLQPVNLQPAYLQPVHLPPDHAHIIYHYEIRPRCLNRCIHICTLYALFAIYMLYYLYVMHMQERIERIIRI
jgi:hypothetical protein